MRLKYLLLSGIACLGILTSQATGTDPNGTDNGEKNKKVDMLGSVVNSNTKKALSNVNITAYRDSRKEISFVTDCTGTFLFDELKGGEYKIVFEKEGYKKVTREKVQISPDEAFRMNVEMVEESAFDLLPSPFHF